MPKRAISDPLSHQHGHSFAQTDDDMEAIQHSASQMLPEGHREWHPGMSAQLAASSGHLPPRPTDRKATGAVRSNAADPFRGSLYSASEDISDDLTVQSARTVPRATDMSAGRGGRSIECPHLHRGSSDPFRNSLEVEEVVLGHSVRPSAAVYEEERQEKLGGPLKYERRAVTDDDTYPVQSTRPHSRATSNPQRPSQQTIMEAPMRSSSRHASGGDAPPSSRPLSRPSSAGGNEPPVYYTTAAVLPDCPGIAARPYTAQESKLVWSPQEEGGTLSPTPPTSPWVQETTRDTDDDFLSVQSGRSLRTTGTMRKSGQTMMSMPSRPSTASSPRGPSIASQPPLRPSELTEVSLPPGEQSGLLGVDSEDENTFLGRPLGDMGGMGPDGRSLSAYVDINTSYDHVRDSSMEMLDEENPMNVPPTSRGKAGTYHSYFAGSDHVHVAPAHRRPSPVDQRNIDEFKRGRRSRRASAKTTQL